MPNGDEASAARLPQSASAPQIALKYFAIALVMHGPVVNFFFHNRLLAKTDLHLDLGFRPGSVLLV
jgi:hypothetical protein